MSVYFRKNGGQSVAEADVKLLKVYSLSLVHWVNLSVALVIWMLTVSPWTIFIMELEVFFAVNYPFGGFLRRHSMRREVGGDI